MCVSVCVCARPFARTCVGQKRIGTDRERERESVARRKQLSLCVCVEPRSEGSEGGGRGVQRLRSDASHHTPRRGWHTHRVQEAFRHTHVQTHIPKITVWMSFGAFRRWCWEKKKECSSENFIVATSGLCTLSFSVLRLSPFFLLLFFPFCFKGNRANIIFSKYQIKAFDRKADEIQNKRNVARWNKTGFSYFCLSYFIIMFFLFYFFYKTAFQSLRFPKSFWYICHGEC